VALDHCTGCLVCLLLFGSSILFPSLHHHLIIIISSSSLHISSSSHLVLKERSVYYQPIWDANLLALLLIFLCILPLMMCLVGLISYFLVSSPTRRLAQRMGDLARYWKKLWSFPVLTKQQWV
jgi:hypothetical protein